MYNYSIFDAHCDTLCRLADCGGDIKNNTYNVDKNRMLRYRSYTQVFACFIAPEYHSSPMRRCRELLDCSDIQDFEGIKTILSLEGGEPIESLEDIDYLYSRGIRCIALTWNGSNKIAGGADCSENGLTEFGKAVVRKMEKLGILVDVSHLNDRSFYDIAGITSAPIIATHSNSRAVCAHRRNLTDDMFRIIRDSGGCAGINLYPPFLTKKHICTISDAVRHVLHFMNMGEAAVGIGADFDGTDDMLPEGIKGCGELYKLIDAVRYAGVGADNIERLTHSNFERVFSEVTDA